MEGGRREGGTYTADDVVVVREVGFAVLAAVDLVTVQIRVICETHAGGLSE